MDGSIRGVHASIRAAQNDAAAEAGKRRNVCGQKADFLLLGISRDCRFLGFLWFFYLVLLLETRVDDPVSKG